MLNQKYLKVTSYIFKLRSDYPSMTRKRVGAQPHTITSKTRVTKKFPNIYEVPKNRVLARAQICRAHWLKGILDTDRSENRMPRIVASFL